MKDSTVRYLALLVSSKCNLHCDFCFFKRNKIFHEYNNIIKSAWEDDTYIPNVIKTLKILKQEPKNILGIDLWGGETLYDLTYFNPHIKDLYSNFPNIEHWWIPTNFSINIDQLITLLQNIEKYTNNPTTILLQLSIDGPVEIAGHKVQLETYKQNIENFFSQINNFTFKKVKVDLSINSVLGGQEYFEYFATDEHIKDYIEYMSLICKLIKKHNQNPKISFHMDTIMPKIASPSEATTHNGIELADILRRGNFILKTNFPELYKNRFSDNFKIYEKDISFAPNYECNSAFNNLCILPDGTIAECINHYLMQNKEYQKELLEQNNEDVYTTTKFSSAISYNPQNMTSQELSKHLRYINQGYRNNFSTYKCLSLGTCLELLASHQIDDSYQDLEKLFNHINLMEQECNCTAYNHDTTRIPYLTSPGNFRKFLNGALDYIEIQNKLRKEQMKNNDK